MASVTRGIGVLDERLEFPCDGPFATSWFTLKPSSEGWVIEPSPVFKIDNGIILNGVVVAEPRRLEDDDVWTTGLGWWVFHEGPVARDAVLEASTLRVDDEPGWLVLADWLSERGDPLAAVISRERGRKQEQSSLFPPRLDFINWLESVGELTTDAEQRLEVSTHHGVVRRLVARSLTDSGQLLAALAMRRMRFVEEVVLDVEDPEPDHEAWLRLVRAHLPSAHTRVVFSALSADRAILEGLGLPRLVGSGCRLVHDGRELQLHQRAGGEPATRHYRFELDGGRWWLVASDLNGYREADGPRLTAAIADWQVRRTPLLDGDLITFNSGEVLRFRLAA